MRTNILGVGVSAVTMPAALQAIEGWVTRRDPHYVCLATVHGVVESQRDEKLRHIYNQSGLTTADGMPLVWLSRLSGRAPVERVYGPDLMLAVCERSLSRGYRHFLYGGGAGVGEKLASHLRHRLPGLNIVGTYSPPFRPLSLQEDQKIVDRINAARPDFVWVGLGAPKQEYWMADHLTRLNAPVLLGVGAAFDFLSGVKAQAPYWMQRGGLEWLFRLLSEPRRLWRRYLLGNAKFLYLIFLQALGLIVLDIDE